MGACLTEEQIKDLAAGTLAGEGAASLLSHASTCVVCRDALAEWRRNAPFLDMLRRTYVGQQPAVDRERPPLPIEPVPGYDNLRQVHRGAQGVVYRAVETASGDEVAVKFIGGGASLSEAGRRRFDREIELIAGLHHPGIIRTRASGMTHSGRQYFVMDYVEGLPLQRYVWQSGLSIDETLALFVRVCEAVNYAHQRGVIHRDLKPSNILVAPDVAPRVLDFGLARHTYDAGDTMLSVTGQIMGTLPYMSPEQTRGDRGEVDIRTDVYALGVILYEILTGLYPYPVTGMVAEALHHIAETPPVPPSRAWKPGSGIPARPGRPLRRSRGGPSCPIDDAIDTIVLKALAKEPHRRYANVAMLVDDLSRRLHGLPIEARREAWIHAFRKRLTRYRMAVMVACGCALLTAMSALVNWQMYQSLRIEHSRTTDAQERLAVAFMALGDNALNRGDHEEASGNYRAALAIMKDLVAGDPHDLDYLAYWTDANLRLGDLDRSRGSLPAAAEYYATARESARRLAAADPTNPGYHARLAQGADGHHDASVAGPGLARLTTGSSGWRKGREPMSVRRLPSGPSFAPGRRRGFSLLELMVVVAIIALLVSLLLPSLVAARREAKRVACQANLKQLGTAWFAYLARSNGEFLRSGKLPDINFGGRQGRTPPYQCVKPLNRYLGLTLLATEGAEVFSCPMDTGAQPDVVPTHFAVYGTSYFANPLLIGPLPLLLSPLDPCSGTMSQRLDVVLSGLKTSQLSNESRLLLVGDAVWQRAWNVADKTGIVQWHQRPRTYNLAFMDGHVDFLRIRKGIHVSGAYTVMPTRGLQNEAARYQKEVTDQRY